MPPAPGSISAIGAGTFAFGIFKLIVVLQQIYIRYLRGQTQDERFAHFGDRIRAMAGKGVAVIEGRLS